MRLTIDFVLMHVIWISLRQIIMKCMCSDASFCKAVGKTVSNSRNLRKFVDCFAVRASKSGT